MVCTTHRRRKPDSNHWYRVTRSRFRERLMSPPLDFPLTEKSTLARRKRRAPPAGLGVRTHFPPAENQQQPGWSSRRCVSKIWLPLGSVIQGLRLQKCDLQVL